MANFLSWLIERGAYFVRGLKTLGKAVGPPPSSTTSEDRGTFYLDDPPDLRKHVPNFDTAIALIEKYSPSGAQIIRWARANKIGFKKLTDQEIDDNWGKYISRARTVGIGDNTADEYVFVLSHEMMHAVQDIVRNADFLRFDWNIRRNVNQTLHTEAAAETFAIRVVYEMKLNGYENAFNAALAEDDSYSAFYAMFDQIYAQHKQSGTTDIHALNSASRATYETYISNQGEKNSYNSDELEYYIEALFQDNQKSRPLHKFSQIHTVKKIREWNRLLDGTYLHDAPPSLQSDDVLIGDMHRMKQAFDYVEYSYLRKLHKDHQNPKVVKKRTALEEDNNPYLGLDLKRVFDAMSANNPVQKNILRIMNELADEQTGQLRLDIISPEEEKILAAARKTTNTENPTTIPAGRLITLSP